MKVIKISNTSELIVSVKTKTLTLEEAVYISDNFIVTDFDQAARDLIEAMKGQWCVSLLEAIKNECENQIVEHWTKYSPSQIEKIKNGKEEKKT